MMNKKKYTKTIVNYKKKNTCELIKRGIFLANKIDAQI